MSEEKLDTINEFETDDSDEVQNLYEHYRFEVDKGQSLLRIDKYLTNIMAGVSRNRIQDAADAAAAPPAQVTQETRTDKNTIDVEAKQKS